jgi:hypothetical protein
VDNGVQCFGGFLQNKSSSFVRRVTHETQEYPEQS